MMKFLKNHPFAVTAYFDTSTVLTFAVPKEQLQNLIPECLELDTFQDKWAFIAIAMVQTKYLRPKGFPKIVGHNFFLTGYRIFVRYRNNAGKRLRGLYIIKSETDRKRMEFLGNVFTQYKYTTTDIHHHIEGNQKTIRSKQSKFSLTIDLNEEDVSLPESSPFNDWKEARRFAGPLPFTFSYNQQRNEVLIVEGVRQNWKPQPIRVQHYEFAFLKNMNIQHMVLANAFEIKDVPYSWKKGRIEKWK